VKEAIHYKMSKKSDKKEKDKKSKKDHKKKKNKKEKEKEKEKKKKDQKERLPSDNESEGEPQSEVNLGMRVKDEDVSIFDNRGVIAEESTLYNVGAELQRPATQEDRLTRLTTSLFPIKSELPMIKKEEYKLLGQSNDTKFLLRSSQILKDANRILVIVD
jgi:hypothetical protein